MELGHARSFSDHAGGLVLGRNAVDPARWKRYRGGTAGEIWLQRAGSEQFTKLPLPNGNTTWPMWIGERIYFLADHEGIGNIYSCALAGNDVRRHSNESEYYARFPSTDGKRIVYSAGGDLKIYDVAADSLVALEIATHSTAPQRARRFEHASETLEHFTPSPDGTHVAFDSRGQTFTMPLFDGAVIRHGEGSAARSRLAEWLHDGERLAAVTDVNGYEQIAVYRADATTEPKLVTDGDVGRITDLCCSPCADVVAFANHRHELCIVDLDDRKVRVIDTCPTQRIEDWHSRPTAAISPTSGRRRWARRSFA